MRSGEILVTGGSGFVGRAVVRALADSGHSVRVLSRRVVPVDHPLVAIYHGDITSPCDLERAVRGCSAVFHCAAEKGDASRMIAVNVTGTRHLFDAARDARVEFFCQLSSVGAIGRTDRPVVNESTPCNPMNVYEETKLAAEHIVAEGLLGGRIVILRPTNVFGAETIQSFLDGSLPGLVRMFLKGREGAHLVYVKDVSAAAVFLFHQTAEQVATYIVSSDEDAGNTNREVLAYLRSRIETVPRWPVISAPPAVPYLLRRLSGRAANRGDVIYSSKKLRAAAFEFTYGLRKGLDDAVSSPSFRKLAAVSL